MKSLTFSVDGVYILPSEQDGKLLGRRGHIIYFFYILLMPYTIMADLDEHVLI